MANHTNARHEQSVARLYSDHNIVETYLERRFSFAWSRLLHHRQVAAVNQVIKTVQPEQIIEIAPGPARIAIELRGVRKGLMIDYSEPMLSLAHQRLAQAGLDTIWELRHHNAFDLESLQQHGDFVYSFRFIRHFETQERSRLYRSIHHVLKNGGFLMLDVVNRDVRQLVDAKNPPGSSDELDVFDATFAQEEFSQEMIAHGFSVVSLIPVVHYFFLQSWISYKLHGYLSGIANFTVKLLEQIPARSPLEWIALVKKAN